MAMVPLLYEYPSVCSICAAAFTGKEGTIESSRHSNAIVTHSSRHRHHAITPLPRIGGLDASFVNIPHHHTSAFERDVHDIESILDNALRSSSSCEGYDGTAGGCGSVRNSSHTIRKEIVNGADMQEASRRMDVFLESAIEILSGEESNSVEGGDQSSARDFYCRSCIDR